MAGEVYDTVFVLYVTEGALRDRFTWIHGHEVVWGIQ